MRGFFSTIVLVYLLSGTAYADTLKNFQIGEPRQTNPESSVSSSRFSVDTMIVIAVDVSGSVEKDEYELQKSGVVNALRDPDVQNLLNHCNTKGVGLTYIEWSGSRKGNELIHQALPWTHLTSPQDLEAVAQQISAFQRSSAGETDIAVSLEYSLRLFENAPFESANKIISLSTDGRQSFTMPGLDIEEYVQSKRNLATQRSVAIHGIAIDKNFMADPTTSIDAPYSGWGTADETSLEDYLKKNVVTGENPLLTTVSDFKAYSEAFKKQLKVMFNGCIS